MGIKKFIKAKLPSHYFVYYRVLRKYWFSKTEIKIIKALTNHEKNSIDVGACWGVYTYFMSLYSRKVFAYEPHPEAYRILAKSVRPNVTVYNVAISDKHGKAILNVPADDVLETIPQGTLSSKFNDKKHKEYSVLQESIDSYCLNDIGFVKIDVEGHEEFVIEGMKNLLICQRPNLFMEIEQIHLEKDIYEVFSKITDLGYDGYFIMDGLLINVNKFNVEQHQKDTCSDVFSNYYVNNFIFIPKENNELVTKRILQYLKR